MRPSCKIGLCLLCLVALGCSNEAETDADSGRVFDAGEARDAFVLDAHTAHELDASEEIDAAREIDAAPPMDAGESMDASIQIEGDRCQDALDVTAGVHLTEETTIGMSDDYAPAGPTCPRGGASSGPDRTYVVRPTEATTYQVRVTPSTSTFDPMLYAMRICGGGCVAGTVFNGAGEPEEIEFSVEAGEEVYIIVDGEVGTAGSYTLEVTRDPA